MNAAELFGTHFGECPLVAVIRGVTPGEAVATAQAIFDGGIRIIEVPLNSPEPFESIGRIAEALGDKALIGAGTVLDPNDVDRVRSAGGRIIVSPNIDERVMGAAVSGGMVSLPGYFTPSEAFAAIRAGAHGLKFFPAEAASPAVLKAQKAVLPKGLPVLAVGGISPDSMASWRSAGADGFGLGSGLYKPGQDAQATAEKARAYVAAIAR